MPYASCPKDENVTMIVRVGDIPALWFLSMGNP